MSTSSQSPGATESTPAPIGQVRELLESLCENEEIRVEFLTHLLGRAACRQLAIYRLPDDFVLSVVVPVYNEVETLPKLIAAIRESGVACEIILVDDGSTDGTREMLDGWRNQSDLKILFHEQNQGKGAALRTGFCQATGDAVIIQDADLEYSPDDYRALLQPIVMEGADVVYGSRFIPGSRNVPRLRHYLPNKILTWWSNLFTNFLLTDMETCYKVFRRDIIQQIGPTLKERRFGIEPELTAKLSRIKGLKLREVPIRYFPRTYSEGKKIGWRDGFRALWCVIRY
ncbi:glycosyltransferase family 2 protein [Blastopirellula sp. JC732]|uniref:Glycosyltransferase family 2 protein n=1 Tax=Blastopirellula sediminis TaxID=2894196 RepID=A0A9X1SH05_9BACT|nr:glycosyltransferase family 2 protein [Blastopirellula sediminis]MCC9607446.1 glycosyltransferase family 2 protein [Blastopirellula sediminis]MCC9629261.1 glycosyltransferase family 2 protein [Blastopirellula sediminis]